jgi:hypothetical protein
MRIWVGKEQEGIDAGLETLFVESKVIYEDIFPLIYRVLELYNIKRIYLGAGRVDCLYVEKAAEFAQRCKDLGLTIIQESSTENAPFVSKDISDCAEIILTVRVKDMPIFPHVSFKLDNYEYAVMHQQTITSTRSLEDVKDNMYECDTLIYEDIF